LQKIAAQVKLDQRAATAYVNAVSPMKSDYERRRALAAVLGLRPLPTGVAELAMRSAADMKSDYEKSELLRTALQTKTVERGHALLEAMRQMQSAYEKRRVLTEALAVEPLSADLKKGVLMFAAGVNSDYERGTVLRSFLERYAIDGALRQPFFGALN